MRGYTAPKNISNQVCLHYNGKGRLCMVKLHRKILVTKCVFFTMVKDSLHGYTAQKNIRNKVYLYSREVRLYLVTLHIYIYIYIFLELSLLAIIMVNLKCIHCREISH